MFRRSRPLSMLFIAAALTVLPSGCAEREAATPAEAAQRFYAMLDALGVHSVPDSLSLVALRPFIADSLSTELIRASRAVDSKLRTGDTSRVLRGDPFSSLIEGRTNARPIATIDMPDTGLVVAAVSNSAVKPSVNWTDTVVVVRERGRWVVGDIRYGAGWDFAFRGSLLDLLQRERVVRPDSAAH